MISIIKNNLWIIITGILLFLLTIIFIFMIAIPHSTEINIEEDIFAATDYEFSQDCKKISKELCKLAKTNGFMTPFRKVYKVAFSIKETNFIKKLAYAASLLKISLFSNTSKSHRNSAIRLFIHFCRINLIEIEPATNLTKLFKKYKILDINKDINNLWKNYLKLIFTKRIAKELSRTKKISDQAKAFLALSPELSVKAMSLIASKTMHLEERYKYLLKENATGESEDDFIQEKTMVEVFW